VAWVRCADPVAPLQGRLFRNRRALPKDYLVKTLYVECTVEQVPHMRIVQIVLDEKLLHAADQAAKRTKRNRSALVRDALREYLRRLELRASEERDRQGYLRHSQADTEAPSWESAAAWPGE
jgi:ribbon-helix-helix CopG family protein